MASLTNAAIFTKKFLAGFGIFIVALIALFFILMVSGNIKNALFPPKADPALIAFDKLPSLDLSEGIEPPVGVTYKVETVTGQLEELQPRIKVFGIKKPDARFGDVESANVMAKDARFKVPANRIDSDKAIYVHSEDPARTLEVELKTGNIFVNSGYLSDPEVITTQARLEEPSGDVARNFLRSFNIDVEDFEEDRIEFIKLKVDGGRLVDAVSISTANIVQVNYYASAIDKIPVKSPQFKRPKLRVLVAEKGVVAAKASASEIQKYKFSTYPLKGVKQAFVDLQAGRTAYNKVFNDTLFTIRNVSLAYLDTENFQQYLQPVYVFEGDEGVEAYVPAVSDSWIVTDSN